MREEYGFRMRPCGVDGRRYGLATIEDTAFAVDRLQRTLARHIRTEEMGRVYGGNNTQQDTREDM